MQLKADLLKLATNVMDFGKKNKPGILTGFAVVGIVLTGVSAYRAGLVADEILENYRKDMRDVKHGDKEAKNAVIKETAKELIPVVVPPMLLGVTSIACALGSHCESHKRIAALSAAYSISEKAVTELNDKMKEMLGEKKAKEVKDAINKDKLKKKESDLKKNGTTIDNEILNTGGNVRCIDHYTQRPFWSNADKIKRAINELSSRIIVEMYVSLNDFYELINLARIPDGDDIGWSIDDTDKGRLPIDFSTILTEDDYPCLYVNYDLKVKPEYRSLH